MKKLYTHRSLYAFFAVCWAAYCSTYLGRLTFTACIAEITTAEGISKTQLGQVAGVFFVVYGAGQLCSGFLADRLSPRRLVGFGLLGSALLNWGTALSHGVWVMTVLWGFNGLVQSLAWAPLVRTVSDLTTEQHCARICLNLATTTPAGTLAAYLVCVAAIAAGSWRAAFWTGGAVMAAAGIVWLAVTAALERTAREHGIEETRAGAKAREACPVPDVRRLILCLVPVGFAALTHGALKDGIMTWVPSYLQETFGFPAAVCVALTMAVPLVNLSGVYFANSVNVKRLRNETDTALVFFVLCGVCIGLWLTLGQRSLVVTLLMLAVSTTCMTAVSTMLLSILPLRFIRLGLVATITGVLNALTYAGSAVSGSGFGVISDSWGWGAVLLAWLATAAAGAALCAAGRTGWKRFLRDTPEA